MSNSNNHFSALEVVIPSTDPEHVPPQYYQAPEVLPFHNPETPKFEAAFPNTPPREEKARILCLGRKTFWIVLVILVIIIAGAIGGGVGGALASDHSKSASATSSSTPQTQRATSTPTPTSASATTPTPSTSSASASATAAVSGCNATDRTFFTPQDSSSSNKPFRINGTTLLYEIYCYTNIASKTSGSNPLISEILRLQNINTLQDCITACAAYNEALTSPTLANLCSVPVWRGINPENTVDPPTCFLQSGPAKSFVTLVFDAGQEIDTAILQYSGLN